MNRERIEKNSKQVYDKERLARIFDRQAEFRSKHVSSRTADSIPGVTARVAVEHLNLNLDDVVLDVGCGVGARCIQIAQTCNKVIGVDISKKSLEIARKKASQANLRNVIFAYGELENPSSELDLTSYGINKILAVYSLHHLPDEMKVETLEVLTSFLTRPGRIVIGDLMFFEDPANHRKDFEKVHYDEGDTDFPCRPELLGEKLETLGAKVKVKQIHPLVGVLTANFT